ncbi:WD40 repeat domain-containing protein [Nocardioides sp. WS12]|uniref:WD40 repeat domain-containing protein n=1 Tax=Nocardioides sp. WS12 TaxID=2486272 RepID=UPI0015FC030C|nr:WD40 repeat domain-containing protein [Nocardioides sp. WS12]
MEKLLLLALPFGIGFLMPGAAAEPVPGAVVFSYTDPDIVESSGLVARDDLVVTVNDSGDSNRIFTVDPTTGDTVGVTRWQGDARDIEALAPAGNGEVYVGDIGDNEAKRGEIEIARVPFGRGNQAVDAATYDLVYPDGPHDAESLLVHPKTGQVFVVAKEFIGRLYAAPEDLKETGRNELTAVDEVLGIATDGAFFPDGEHLVLRNYGQAAVYTWPDLDRVAMVDLPSQQQGEGIAVSESGEVLIGSEGAHSEVLRVEVPIDEPTDESPAPTPTPDSSSEAVPVTAADDRSLWPWALGGVAGVAIIAVLLRSLRPRP